MKMLENRLFQKSPLKLKNRLFLFISIATLQMFSLNVQAGDFNLIQVSVDKCIASGYLEDCKTALQRVGEFRALQVSDYDYPCQTRLLGLEAKLLMVIINFPKARLDPRQFENLNQACSQAF